MPQSTFQPPSPPPARRRVRPGQARSSAVALAASFVCGLAALPAAAVEFGPFSLTGFAKVEFSRTTNVCEGCQREDGEGRHRIWADDLVYGKPFGTQDSHVTLFQPYLGFKQKVGGGWELFGLLSQRWRDGKIDLDGWVYERNVGAAHEDWGRFTFGAMTTRGWSAADYPFSFNAIQSDRWGGSAGFNTVWSDSGAAYGMLSRAARWMSRPIEFLNGDVLLEATYDSGKGGWERNKPHFVELYAKYIQRDLVVDLVAQASRNGEPVAWGKAPFGGLTPFPQDDKLLGSSGQGMFMAMARQVINDRWEISGGIRFNRWSGAYAAQMTPGPLGRWNSMFNVHWNGFDADGAPNPGYAARSTDVMLGLRYRIDDKWTASTGLVYLGKATTDNPMERGQSNTLLANTWGLGYKLNETVHLSASASFYQYGRKGPAPLSVPAHNAFTNIDPRVATRGNSLGVGANFTF